MAFGITAAMVFTAVAPTVIGAIMADGSAGAAQEGAGQQVAANNAAIAETRAAREQQRTDLMPWMTSGGQANTELMRRLGLGGTGRIGGFTPKTEAQLRSEMLGQFTSMQPGSGGRGSVLEFLTKAQDPENAHGGMKWSDPIAGSPGVSTVDEAGLSAAARNAFNAQGAAQEGEIDPEYGSLMRKFNQQDLDTDLVYQNGLKFGLDTGTDQVNQRAINQGGYGSGAALKALTRFGNDFATTKTGGAYDRNMGQKNQIFGFLSGTSQQGQNAAAGVGAAGMNAASQIGGYQTGIGNSQAAGTIAGANAWNSFAGKAVTDAQQWNQLLSRNNRTPNAGPATWRNGNAFSDTGDY